MFSLVQKQRKPEEFTPTKRESVQLEAPPERPPPVEEEIIAPEEEKPAYQRAPREKPEETPDDRELVMGKADVSLSLFQTCLWLCFCTRES